MNSTALLHTVVVLAALLAAQVVPGPAPALAQPAKGAAKGAAKDRAKNPTKDKAAQDAGKPEGSGESGSDEVDTEGLFGFTEGSDTGKKGERDVILDTVGRFGKRRGGSGRSYYDTASTRLSFQYDPTENLSLEFGVFGDVRRVRNIADLDDKAFAAFDGVSVNVKYQFFKGSDDNPVGLAVETRPRFARVLPIEGRGADIFDIETVLQADVRLVPDKLWFGSNLSIESAAGRQRGSGEGDRSSVLLWSNAVVARVAENTFLGPEVRYFRAYDGTYLNRFEGHAVFVGPALHHRFTEKVLLTLAYSAQVWGHDRDPAYTRRGLDLGQFERHNVRVRLAVEF